MNTFFIFICVHSCVFLFYFCPDLTLIDSLDFVLQQASFLTLKELRDSCKIDLEMINEMPADKH